METISLRAIERLLGVIIGGSAIYLGYRLFIESPKQTESSGKIILPGGVSVFLSRIGPGALFGAVWVTISFRNAITVDMQVRGRAGVRGQVGRYVGAGSGLGRADNVNSRNGYAQR